MAIESLARQCILICSHFDSTGDHLQSGELDKVQKAIFVCIKMLIELLDYISLIAVVAGSSRHGGGVERGRSGGRQGLIIVMCCGALSFVGGSRTDGQTWLRHGVRANACTQSRRKTKISKVIGWTFIFTPHFLRAQRIANGSRFKDVTHFQGA